MNVTLSSLNLHLSTHQYYYIGTLTLINVLFGKFIIFLMLIYILLQLVHNFIFTRANFLCYFSYPHINILIHLILFIYFVVFIFLCFQYANLLIFIIIFHLLLAFNQPFVNSIFFYKSNQCNYIPSLTNNSLIF